MGDWQIQERFSEQEIVRLLAEAGTSD